MSILWLNAEPLNVHRGQGRNAGDVCETAVVQTRAAIGAPENGRQRVIVI
jgi:hypothetical protein